MRARTNTRKWLKRGAWTVLALALLPVLALVATQTPHAKRFIAARAAGLASALSGMRVEVEGLSGWLPFSLEVRRISVADVDGVFLHVEDVRVDWSAGVLFRGEVRLSTLSARRADFARIPKMPARETPRPEPFAVPALPGPPRWLTVEALAVETFTLGAPVLGQTAVFHVNGETGAVSSGEWAAQLAAVRTDAEETRVQTVFRATAEGLALDINARDETLFPALPGVEPPFLLSLAGRGVDGVWAVSLALDAGDMRVAALDKGRLVLGPPLEAAGTLAVNTGHPAFRQAVAPRLGKAAELAFDLSLAGNGGLAVRAFEATSNRASAVVSGTADLAAMRFDIEMDMRHEDAGTLVPALSAGPPVPLHAEATVTGTLATLETAATLTLDGQPAWESAFTIAARPPYGVRGSFHATPPPALLPEQVRALAEDGAEGRVALRLDRGLVIDIEELEVEAAGARMSARGVVDPPGERANLAWSFDADALAAYGALLNAPLSGALKAEGTLTGGPGEARLTAALHATEVAAGPASMDAARLELTVTAGAWAEGALADLRAEAAGDVRQFAVAGAPPADLSLVAHTHSPDLDHVTLSQLTVTAPGATLEGSGEAGLASLAGTATLTLTADDLAAVLAPFGVPGAGRVDLEAAVDFDVRARRVEATVRGSGEDLASLPPPLDAAGDAFALQIRALFAEETLEINELQFESPNLTVAGGGSYAAAANSADLRFRAQAESLAPFSVLAGVPLGGRLDATITAQGPPEAIVAGLDARVADLRVQAAGVALATVTARVEGLPAAPRGEVALTLERDRQSLRGNAAFVLEAQRLALQPITLEAGENRVSGRMDMAFDPLGGRGEFDAALPDFAYFGALLGIPLAGMLEARAEFEFVDGAARVQASGKTAGVESGVLRLDKAAFELRASGLPANPAVDGTLDAQGLVLESGHALHSLHATVAGDAAHTRIEAQWDGTVLDGTPVRGTLEADAAPDVPAVTLNVLEGELGAFPFKLAEPATLNAAAGEYALDSLEMRFGEGSVTASGRYTAATVDFRAALHEFPLALAELAGAPELSGTISGEATLEGPPSLPRATARFNVAGLRTDAMPETAPAIDARFEAAAADGFASFHAALDAGDAGTATARAELPAVFSLRPAAVAVEPDAPLGGALEADLKLGPLVRAFAPPDHHFAGALSARFELGGAAAAPELRGDARVENARYENAATGTLLDKLNIVAEAAGTRVRLVEMSATDGAQGTVGATGELDLGGEAFPFTLDVDIASARLVRRDDVTGSVSGNLRVAGDLREVAVTGELVAGPAVIRVPEKLPPPALPQAEVIEVNVPGAPPPAAREGSAPATRITLDVRCRVPRRVVVRAPVLDTEWEGDLHVMGTADSPRIDGLLRIHKGYLDFLGRRFALEGSTLSFDGSSDLMPYVNLAGRADTRDITGILRVTGKPDQLRFSLDSEPVYPEDEVLARLLFGRRLDELSPVQAVQLARAATMLTGSVGGMRFLAGEMGAPGLGGFDVRAGDAPGEAVVGLGTYLTDNIYAEIEQSTGSMDTQTRVNIQLTPQFSVEAETGTGKTQGGGLFWKREY